MNISVSDILKSQNAVFHEDGLFVFEAVDAAMKGNEKKVEVSFEDIRVCTTQFLNASFGKLLLAYGDDVIKQRVHPVSYSAINAFSEKYNLVWENFHEKNKEFLEEAYA